MLDVTEPVKAKVYPVRWMILFVFCSYSFLNEVQWIQYSIIGDILQNFYNVDVNAINWMSLIYNLIYIPLILPCCWGLEKYGLMHAALIGAGFNALGACIKLIAVSPGLFWLAFIGQAIAGIAQVWILGVPAMLAARWFSAEHVSLATAIGVFGNQLGIAAGFIAPSLFIRKQDMYSNVLLQRELSNLMYLVTSLSVLSFILVVAFFSGSPPTPPSYAQAVARMSAVPSYRSVLKSLFTNADFVLLLLTYGISVGTFNSFSTLLNPILIVYFPKEESAIGQIGLTYVLCGLVGSILSGYVLDKTHKYKLCINFLYFMSFVMMVAFSCVLLARKLWPVYLVSGALGFFQAAYVPVGFEFAVELTYPTNEGVTSGLINMAGQAIGTILILGATPVLKKYGPLSANGIACIALFIGLILTALIKERLLRHSMEMKSEKEKIDLTETQNTYQRF